MAHEARAVVTNEAKQRTAEMWAYGTSFKVMYFEISAGGHDPADPTTALAPDPSATAIPGVVLFGPEVIDSVEWESIMCPRFICTIDQGEYIGELSSVGLKARIVYDPARPAGAPVSPGLAYEFLFAVYNRPRLILTSTDGPTNFELMPFM